MIKADLVNQRVARPRTITKQQSEKAVDDHASTRSCAPRCNAASGSSCEGSESSQVQVPESGASAVTRAPGKEVRIPPGRTIRFKPGKDLQDIGT